MTFQRNFKYETKISKDLRINMDRSFRVISNNVLCSNESADSTVGTIFEKFERVLHMTLDIVVIGKLEFS